jgi:hypothetical protein
MLELLILSMAQTSDAYATMDRTIDLMSEREDWSESDFALAAQTIDALKISYIDCVVYEGTRRKSDRNTLSEVQMAARGVCKPMERRLYRGLLTVRFQFAEPKTAEEQAFQELDRVRKSASEQLAAAWIPATR